MVWRTRCTLLSRCAHATALSFQHAPQSDNVRSQLVFGLQLAQTTMRSELGKITLDKTFEERAALNENIVKSIQ